MALMPLIRGKAVLDVACGRGKWGYLTRVDRGGDDAYIVGCDAFKPNLLYVKKHAIYDDCVLCDVRQMPYRSKIFEIAIACEILEHLEKTDGSKFLSEAQRICGEKLIVTTPNFFMQQDVINGNVFQIHKASWSCSDLEDLGFNVSGIGLRSFLSYFSDQAFAASLDTFMFGRRKAKLRKLLILLYLLMSNFSFFLPKIGVFLVAEKDMD
jgi:2-polyprenyl-3-methyl-5-hydroxy-6-metoxy-1,4-benzoquinol methylase